MHAAEVPDLRWSAGFHVNPVPRHLFLSRGYARPRCEAQRDHFLVLQLIVSGLLLVNHGRGGDKFRHPGIVQSAYIHRARPLSCSL